MSTETKIKKAVDDPRRKEFLKKEQSKKHAAALAPSAGVISTAINQIIVNICGVRDELLTEAGQLDKSADKVRQLLNNITHQGVNDPRQFAAIFDFAQTFADSDKATKQIKAFASWLELYSDQLFITKQEEKTEAKPKKEVIISETPLGNTGVEPVIDNSLITPLTSDKPEEPLSDALEDAPDSF